MTEELIKAITDAEKQAEAIKAAALENAAAIIAAAEAEILQNEQAAAEANKKYREEQILAANQDAEKAYQATVAKKKEEAKAYCEKAFASADGEIGKIVGRIISGDC